MKSRFLIGGIIAATMVLLSGCSTHKIEQKQGNILSSEQVAKLKVGMPKAQVQLLLGTPLLQDAFHASRWEYIFYQTVNGKASKQRSFTVFFDAEGNLSKWQGDEQPSADSVSKVGLEADPMRVEQAIDKIAAVPVEVNIAGTYEKPPVVATARAVTPNLANALQGNLSAPAPLAVASPVLGASEGAVIAAVTSANSMEKKTPESANLASETKTPTAKAASPSALLASPAASTNTDEASELKRVELAILKWNQNWLSANLEGYLRSYTLDYQGSFPSRAAWLVNRKTMVQDRKILSITLDDFRIQKTKENTARAYFKQSYKADNFQETGEKTLLLEKIDGEWLIAHESFNKS